MSTTSECYCAICGKNFTLAVHNTDVLNKCVVLKEKNITSFIIKSKAREEKDWIAWENKKELKVHEGCRQNFKNKASHPPKSKKNKLVYVQKSVIDDSQNSLDEQASIENNVSAITNEITFINTIVDEIWHFIEDSGRSRFDSNTIKNILDNRIEYNQLCDALLEKHGEQIEIIQGQGRSQALQRRIKHVSGNTPVEFK